MVYGISSHYTVTLCYAVLHVHCVTHLIISTGGHTSSATKKGKYLTV